MTRTQSVFCSSTTVLLFFSSFSSLSFSLSLSLSLSLSVISKHPDGSTALGSVLYVQLNPRHKGVNLHSRNPRTKDQLLLTCVRLFPSPLFPLFFVSPSPGLSLSGCLDVISRESGLDQDTQRDTRPVQVGLWQKLSKDPDVK